ncbi:MAG: hypothetical protein ACRCYU_18520 [Nocardioides sp.]
MAQEMARLVYHWLDTMADGDLSSLARSLHTAPAEHSAHIISNWPDVAVGTKKHRRPGEQLSRLPRGQIRPVLAQASRLDAGLRLLLYVDNILLNSAVLVPFHPFRAKQISPEQLAASIATLDAIRPLVDDGSISFIHAAMPRGRDRDLDEYRRILLTAHYPSEGSRRETSDVRRLGAALYPGLRAGEKGWGTPLALNPTEDLAIRTVLTGPVLDGRIAAVTKLAQLSVPSFSADARTLVAIRNVDAFSRWRTALDNSLSLIGEIPANESGPVTAAEIIGDEMAHRLADLQRVTRRSTVLSAVRSFGRRLSFAGLGTGAGVGALNVLGRPLTGAAVGAASGAAVAGAETLREMRSAFAAQGEAKAVWSVIAAFTSDSSE